MVRLLRSLFVVVLMVGPGLVTVACDDPPPPGPVTPRPSEFDPIVATAAVGTLPGAAEVTTDGTFAYTMPIDVPPGRAGMQPSLSISYDSGGGETALGVGFALRGLSALSRCPRNPAQDGVRAGISFTTDDRLCLDGMRLVAESGTYGEDAVYRTELDDLVRVEHRGEGEDGVLGASSFRVRYPDGREAVYGLTAESRLVAPRPDGSSVVESWLLAELRDASGNAVVYRYEHEAPRLFGVGDDEAGRPLRTRDSVRISRIDYTAFRGDDGVLEAGTRSVRFEYGEERRPNVGSCDDFVPDDGVATGSLCTTPPPHDGFAHGAAIYTPSVRPLERIQTYVGGTLASEYRIEGSEHPASRVFHVTSVTRCANAPAATPADADPSGLVCMPPTVFEWRDRFVDPQTSHLDPRYGLPTFQSWSAATDRARIHYLETRGWRDGAFWMIRRDNPIRALDLDGDGADDVAYLRQVGDRDDTGALYVAWGNPAPRTRAGLTAATTPFTTTSELSLRAMLPELRVDPAFLLSQLRAMRPVDWDQDGRDDLLVVLQPPENAARPRTEGPVVVLRSPGRTRGTAPSRVTLEMIDTGLDIPLADGTAGGRMLYDYVLTDMNGDGRQDLLACVYDVELSVCADNHAILGPVTGISPGTGCRGHWAISVRGETGLQPLVYSDVASDCGYEFGNGHVSSFSFPQDGFDSGGHWSIQPAAGDFDGDGRFEVVIGPEYATSLAAEATSDYTTELGRRRWPRRMLSFDGVNLTAEPIAGFVRPEGQLTVVDVNGDGLHDLVAQDAAFGEADASPVVIHLSTGEGFLAEEIAFAHPGARHVRTRADAGDGRPIRFPIRFLPFDMNRDGRGDLVVSTLRAGRTMPTRSSDFSRTWTWDAESVWMAELPSGAEAYLYSTGVALRWNEYLEGTGGRMPREMRRHDTLVLDGDGDGALDLLDWESVDPDAAATSFRIFHHNVRAEAMVVEHVEDGLGARIDVDYSNSSDAAVYTPGTSCTYPQRCVTDARELVSALHRDDGLGARRTTRYTYLDGRADLAGRGFLGYGQIREVDQTTGIETTTTYDHATRISVGGGHAYPYARRPIARVSFRRDLFTGLDSIRFEGTRERFDYDLTEPGPGRYRVRPLLTFSETLERRSATARGADPFNGARTIRNSLHAFQDYDEHGFARTEITAAGPDNTVATLTYDHDPSSWRFGMVAEITTDAYNGDPGCEREVVTRFVNDLPRALVVEVVRNPDDAATRRSTALGYDRYGNVTEVTRRTDDGTRGETIAWDIEGYFPFELTNAAGHVTTTAYEPRFGGLRASVDPNWVERRAYIDGFGRPRIEESDLGDHSEVAYTRGSTPDTVHVEAQSNVEGRASVELDRLGRVFRSAVFHAYRQSTTDVRYDTRGRVVGVSEPHGTETVFPETVYTYDGLDRLRRVTRPETGDVTSYRFDINAVEVTDPAGAETRTEHDLRGRVRRMVEADPEVRGETDAVTSYTYCMGDELRSIRDDAGNVTRVHYDRLGRRTGLVDPDVGAESYEYDAWDQLLRTTDNAGRISRLSHDVLGRVTDRFDDADGAHFRWEYDTALGPSGRAVLGMLAEAESGDGVVDRFEYDALHRPSAVTRTIDGRSLTLAQSFDTVGRVRQVDYPSIGGDGVSVRYGYHARGDLVSVSDAETGEMYWELLNQEIHGLPNSETVGPLARATSYSATGRLRGIEVTTDAGEALQDVSYNYEARGLLRSRTDRVREQAELVTHDLLGRLTGLFGERTETYDYDLLGNLASSHDSTLDYDGRPHAATRLTTAEGAVTDLVYDDVGNVTDMGALHVEYNQLNLPTSARSAVGTASFAYDSSGSRARKLGSRGSTLYFGNYEVEEDGLTTLERTLITTPAGVVAQVERTTSTLTETRTRWLLSDRLGSIDTAYVPGEAPQHFDYDGFGGLLDDAGVPTGSTPSETVTAGFTAHEHDPELGLINMQGRIYHPRLRRFLSADPLSTGAGQGLNRYSYVRNSPLALVDPSGFDPVNAGRGAHWMPGDLEAESRRAGRLLGIVGIRQGPGQSDGGSDRSGSEVIGDASGVNQNQPGGAQMGGDSLGDGGGPDPTEYFSTVVGTAGNDIIGLGRAPFGFLERVFEVTQADIDAIEGRGDSTTFSWPGLVIVNLAIGIGGAVARLPAGLAAIRDTIRTSATTGDAEATGHVVSVILTIGAGSVIGRALGTASEGGATVASGSREVFRQLSAADRVALDAGRGLLPRGTGGTIARHVAGADTGYISASESIAGASRYASGNGLVAIDVNRAMAAGAGFVDHGNVVAALRRAGDFTAVRNAIATQEVLFTGPISQTAIRFVRR